MITDHLSPEATVSRHPPGSAKRNYRALISSTSSPGILTARQSEVLRLLADGLTNREIAERLVISPRTVNIHVASIYKKLGITSRVAATRYAIEQGLNC